MMKSQRNSRVLVNRDTYYLDSLTYHFTDILNNEGQAFWSIMCIANPFRRFEGSQHALC